jgi:hypothetical protein
MLNSSGDLETLLPAFVDQKQENGMSESGNCFVAQSGVSSHWNLEMRARRLLASTSCNKNATVA